MTREEAIYVLNELLEKVKASQNKTNILAKEKQALEFAIEALKERPHGMWIPCSERLPEESGEYYVSGGDKVWICRCACRRCTKQDEEECKTCEYNCYDKEGE